MNNPPCINCKKTRNLKDKCICNSERRCANCKKCKWCIDKNQNGKCVPIKKYNPNNCPYSFIKKEKIEKEVIKYDVYQKKFLKMTIYKYIFLAITALLILIIIIFLLFNQKPTCPANSF